MGSSRTNKEIAIYTATAIQELEDYLHHLQQIGEPDDKRAEKIGQWISNWTRYLKREKRFNPKSIPALKRGSIVYADFGFNVDREYGGLHYAIVLNRKDSRQNHLLHVLPLTSVKEKTDLNNLKYFQLSIDKEVYRLLREKAKSKTLELKEIAEQAKEKREKLSNRNLSLSQLIKSNIEATEEMQNLLDKHKKLDSLPTQMENLVQNTRFITKEQNEIEIEISELDNLSKILKEKLEYAEKLVKKTDNMNKGSIVLLNQVTTISKLRLYDPKDKNSILNNIVLTSETMQAIDDALGNIF